jgi:hypothetical protein
LSEKTNTLHRIRRDRTYSAVGFAMTTVATVAIAVLRENWAIPSGIWGVLLILWALTGVAWIVTRYLTPVVEAQARQTKQIKRLAEATKVTGWAAAMEDDSNVRRINRR